MGKGIPDKFNVDADVNLDAKVNAAIDLAADVNADVNADMKVAADSKMSMDTTMRFPDVMRTAMETTSRLAITEPIRTEMQMDMKPVVLDLCLNVGFNKLPRTSIKRPYHHCLSLSMFGSEIATFSLAGHRDVIVGEPETRSPVAWGGTATPTRAHTTHKARIDTDAAPTSGQGLRIRLDR
jgi:hypothetical protein